MCLFSFQVQSVQSFVYQHWWVSISIKELENNSVSKNYIYHYSIFIKLYRIWEENNTLSVYFIRDLKKNDVIAYVGKSENSLDGDLNAHCFVVVAALLRRRRKTALVRLWAIFYGRRANTPQTHDDGCGQCLLEFIIRRFSQSGLNLTDKNGIILDFVNMVFNF